MDGNVDDYLLAKYVAGECSAEEAARVRDWVARHPDAAERLARFQHIWEAADAPASQWNAEAAWEKLRRRVKDHTPASSPDVERDSRDRPAKRVRRRRLRRRGTSSNRRSGLRMVAGGSVLAAVVLLALLWIDALPFGSAASEAKVFTAKKGQQATVRLTDGTHVRLNVDSRLTVPERFESDRREVILDGEAYFDVVRDTARAFVVRTKSASVEVLGTAFGVQSYADEDETHVAVTEGRVALHARQSDDRDTVAVLHPRFFASASDEGLLAVREDVDLSRTLAWVDGRLVFENAPFDEVARTLERWYDIQVDVTLPTDRIVGVNATFEDVPLDEVLHDVAAALSLKYRREGRTVTFYR